MFENALAESAPFWVIQSGTEYMAMEEQQRTKYCEMCWKSKTVLLLGKSGYKHET